MGLERRDDIRQAMSHPQALGQCRHWLKARGIEPVSYPDTAGAAAKVAELADPRIAALAPPGAAEMYGLKTLVEDIRSEEHTSELQSLMRISYAVFCLKKKKKKTHQKDKRQQYNTRL